MAPEIIKKTGYLFKADVWSCGVIIYRIITGKFPFCGNNEKELFKKVTQGKFDYPSFVGYKIRSLISQMLRIDEDERISIFEVQ
jgi:MAP/microtubule affinity-regulating kinase